MLNFVSSKEEFEQSTCELNRIFKVGIDIIDNPFHDQFVMFRAFEFDRIYHNEFYEGLNSFLKKRLIRQFTWYTLLPDPANYFFFHFKKFSIGKVSVETSYDHYIEFLNLDPGNPADALGDNSETVAIYSDDLSWGIIGSKDLEIGIVGFKSQEDCNEFESMLSEIRFTDIKSRFMELDEMLNLPLATKGLHAQMIKAYNN